MNPNRYIRAIGVVILLVYNAAAFAQLPDAPEETPAVFLADSLIADSLRYEYTKIKQAAYKSPITKELYKLVFVNSRSGRVNVMRTERSEERFRPYADRMINRIDVRILPPYGTSVEGTDSVEIPSDLNTLEKIANATHIKTSAGVLLRHLTLRSGKPLRPFEVVQNEVLLRQLPFIDDAAILVFDDAEDDSKVNLVVVCKDDFSWGAEVSSNFINKFRLTLTNKNFASLGHRLEYGFSYRGTKEQVWGNVLQYEIRSLFGMHLNVTGFYQNDYQAKQAWVNVDKPFLTSATKWGGGFGAIRSFRREQLPELDVRYTITPYRFWMQDAWAGRSLLLSEKRRYTSNIYLTARLLNLSFDDRPQVFRDSNEIYYNRTALFSAVTYRKIRYYKANLIYDFGRTEDIPVGLSTELIWGVERNDYKTSLYLAGDAKYAYYHREKDLYYAFRVAFGSYLHRNTPERSVISAEGNYISKLYHLGKYRMRFYNGTKYTAGDKRYRDDYLYFTDENIIDFHSDTLRGHQKLSLSLATTLFLPHIVKGFRASVTGTFDMGFITDRSAALFDNKPYLGIGVAVNLRNDNIVFKHISLRLMYYPNAPTDMHYLYASMSGRYGYGFYDYNIYKPGIVPYK